MQRGNTDRRAEPERVKLSLGNLRRNTLGLVHGDDDGLVGAAQFLCYTRVGTRESIGMIHDKYDDVGLGDRQLRLALSKLTELGLIPAETPSIHDEKPLALGLGITVAPVSCEPREIRDERIA